MDRPPTQFDIKREEGKVRITFTPGLTIDQWAEAQALNRPLSRSEFDEAAQELAKEWGVQVSIDPPQLPSG